MSKDIYLEVFCIVAAFSGMEAKPVEFLKKVYASLVSIFCIGPYSSN
jgi:hypothetical protein